MCQANNHLIEGQRALRVVFYHLVTWHNGAIWGAFCITLHNWVKQIKYFDCFHNQLMLYFVKDAIDLINNEVEEHLWVDVAA